MALPICNGPWSGSWFPNVYWCPCGQNCSFGFHFAVNLAITDSANLGTIFPPNAYPGIIPPEFLLSPDKNILAHLLERICLAEL